MARGRFRRGNGAGSGTIGSLPSGPLGPQRRPTSWAAGMEPFGRIELSLVPGISGGQRLGDPNRGARRRTRVARAAPFPLVTVKGSTAQGVTPRYRAPVR